VSPDALRTFLEQNPERQEFFAAKRQALGVARLLVQGGDQDLRNEVAERIYQIRNKIVHTKHGVGTDELDLLLPFSEEADSLGFDIQLVQFIARQVLVVASTPLSIASSLAMDT
jgi:hypothetical protein